MKVKKVLSANDVGTTGGHQAGILVPKEGGILEFFPDLDAHAYNPRARVDVFDPVSGERAELSFIHYNNKLHGSGTRNEFRLTGMTRILRNMGAQPGDSLVMEVNGQGAVRLSLEQIDVETAANEQPRRSSSGWTILKK